MSVETLNVRTTTGTRRAFPGGRSMMDRKSLECVVQETWNGNQADSWDVASRWSK